MPSELRSKSNTCFTKNENIKLNKINKKITFDSNYNYEKCLKLINKAFEQTKNCHIDNDCSLWKQDLNQKFPNLLNYQLNVKILILINCD